MFVAVLTNGMRVEMRNAENHRRIEYGDHQIVDIYPAGEPDRSALKARITELEKEITTLRHGVRP
jgi:hypothetical protein